MRRSLVFALLALATDAYAFDVIAHRANSCGAVENSRAAILASWSVGSDAVELDVRVSSDGVVYLFHDDEIDDLSVRGLKLAEVRHRVGVAAAPTLLSALQSDHDGGYYVLDLKDLGAAGHLDVVAAAKASRINPRKLTFQSDDFVVLEAIRQALPESRYFILERLKRRPPFFVRPNPARLSKRLSAHGFDGISIKGRQFVDRSFIASLQRHGRQVYVWTVNDVSRARHYASLGVDGIITDNTEAILKESGRRRLIAGGCGRATQKVSAIAGP